MLNRQKLLRLLCAAGYLLATFGVSLHWHEHDCGCGLGGAVCLAPEDHGSEHHGHSHHKHDHGADDHGHSHKGHHHHGHSHHGHHHHHAASEVAEHESPGHHHGPVHHDDCSICRLLGQLPILVQTVELPASFELVGTFTASAPSWLISAEILSWQSRAPPVLA